LRYNFSLYPKGNRETDAKANNAEYNTKCVHSPLSEQSKVKRLRSAIV
jgi:hypothetical protein